jgi:hypothetical protein
MAMSFFIVIIGLVVARLGAKLFIAGESQGGQGLGSGLVTLAILLLGFGMIVYGVVRFFL